MPSNGLNPRLLWRWKIGSYLPIQELVVVGSEMPQSAYRFTTTATTRSSEEWAHLAAIIYKQTVNGAKRSRLSLRRSFHYSFESNILPAGGDLSSQIWQDAYVEISYSPTSVMIYAFFRAQSSQWAEQQLRTWRCAATYIWRKSVRLYLGTNWHYICPFIWAIAVS